MHNNNNNLNTAKLSSLIKSLAITCITVSTLTSTQIIKANDLLSGTELKDSPLSLSLSTTVPMTVDNQSQQLVVSQYGIFNKATINQAANADNSIIVKQTGINNLANLKQDGFGNTINLEQSGDDNLAEVIQQGDANIANIKQQGQQTFVVHQIGNDMVVNITQY